MNPLDELMEMITTTAEEAGRDLGVSAAELRQRAGEQMAQLALAVGEPGYQRAVIAARDNVLMLTALEAVENADATDSRIIGIVQAGLFMGAKVLAGSPSDEEGV